MRRNFKFKITREGKGRTAHWHAQATYESLLQMDGHYKWMLIKAIEGTRYGNTELIQAISELCGNAEKFMDLVPTEITVIEENVARTVILKSINENTGFFYWKDTDEPIGSICFM